MRRQNSFSIVQGQDDDDSHFFEDEPPDDPKASQLQIKSNYSDSDSEERSSASPEKLPTQSLLPDRKPDALPRRRTSAGPSGKPPVISGKISNSSDSDDSEFVYKNKKLPGEYDPTEYQDLTSDPEIIELFEYIQKYTPQKITTDFKFKPFIPEFLPAVGDIDAFLKVVPPEKTISGQPFDENILQLGLLVLDEPASNQSDPALLHLQLRAASDNLIGGHEQKNIVVKKIDNVEKNAKVIEKWIKDISHLHKSKSSPIVRYSQPMPDIDDLMQQWPEDLEQKFKEEGFPKPKEDQNLADYVDTVCTFLQIPITKNKIQSLHLLFCLYTAIKQTQLYQAQAVANNEKRKEEAEQKKSDADQLVLE